MTVRTLCDLFRHSVLGRPRPDVAVLARPDGRRAASFSSEEIGGTVERLYHFWQSRGARRGDRALLWMANRPEWAIADFSLLASGLPDVPLYLTLGPAETRLILESSRPRFAVVGDEGLLARLLEAAGGDLRPEAVVVLGTPPPSAPGAIAWPVALENGERRRRERGPEEFLQALAAARPEDLATLLYTSGTTGTPKGVPLTHDNIVSNVLACLQVIDIDERDVALSFLPLCHMYERMLDYCYWYTRSRLVYVSDPRTVADVLPHVRPTALGAVPRFYEKIVNRIRERVRGLGRWRRAFFEWALAVGGEWLRTIEARRPLPPGLALRRAAARILVYRSVSRTLGGRLRLMISGGAPLGRETADFLWALDLGVLQGYGLTETSPVITLNPPDRNKNGTVGPPIPGTRVRIATDGEILVQGPGVMQGYYNAPEATAAAFVDGWFATGDVGSLDPEGYLTITGRKREFIATAGGKKVAPALIEKRLESDPLIAHAALIGDRRPFLSALVVPDFEALAREAGARGIAPADRRTLVERPEVVGLYEERIGRLLADLSRHEQVRRFTLVAEEWTPESGEVTPTLKVRRRIVEERYRDAIERMYAQPPPAGGKTAPAGAREAGSA